MMLGTEFKQCEQCDLIQIGIFVSFITCKTNLIVTQEFILSL